MLYWALNSVMALVLFLEGWQLLFKKTLLFSASHLFGFLFLLWGLGLKNKPQFLLLFSIGWVIFKGLAAFYERYSKKRVFILEAGPFYQDKIIYDRLSNALYRLVNQYKLAPASLVFYPSGLMIIDTSIKEVILEELEQVFQSALKGHYLYSRALGALYFFCASYLILYPMLIRLLFS